MPRSRRHHRIPLAPPAPSSADGGSFSSAAVDYVHNLLCGTSLRRLGKRNVRAIEDSEIIREFAAPHLPPASLDAVMERGFERAPSTSETEAALRSYLRRQRPRRPRPPGKPVRRNLKLLAGVFGFSEVDVAILTFELAIRQTTDLREVWEALQSAPLPEQLRWVAAAVHKDPDRVREALSPAGRLMASGVVRLEAEHLHSGTAHSMSRRVANLLQQPRLSIEEVHDQFLTPARAPTLTRDDYGPVADELGLLLQLLGGALRDRTRGVNILLYGPTGTGKTELASLVASELGVPVFSTGLADDDGDSPHYQERLTSLLAGQHLLPGGNALLLFDELEDLFDEGPASLHHRRRMTGYFSKVWFNNLLETNQTPTVWISNTTHGIDEAFLRRFTYVMPLELPTARQRVRILRRHLGDEAEGLDSTGLEQLARTYEVSPALMGSAVASARLVSEGAPDIDTLERFLAPSYRLLTGKTARRRPDFDPSTYRIEAVEAGTDVAALAERLATTPLPPTGLTMCLYGPPGTGKSELVRHLAWRMDRPLVVRKASDLLSMWVGGTEQNISEAFREAEQEGALLLFDEVDSFLRDRRHATQPWQVTQTNEFLQQLEDFEGIAACTTNLWEDIDRAALRRFVLKVEFRWLTPAKALVLFEAVFENWLSAGLGDDRPRVHSALGRLKCLAPGDFAAVARRLRALGSSPGVDRLVVALEEEVSLKEEGELCRVGF